MSLEYKLPGDASFWEQFDNAFIYPASSVWFYLGEGWKTSEGMRREYEKALEWTKPIYTVESLGCCYAHKQISYQLYKND